MKVKMLPKVATLLQRDIAAFSTEMCPIFFFSSVAPSEVKKPIKKVLLTNTGSKFFHKSTKNRMEWDTIRQLDNGNSWFKLIFLHARVHLFKRNEKKQRVREKYEEKKRQHFANCWYYVVVLPTRLDCLWFFPRFGMQIN